MIPADCSALRALSVLKTFEFRPVRAPFSCFMSCPTNEPDVDFSVLRTPKIGKNIHNSLIFLRKMATCLCFSGPIDIKIYASMYFYVHLSLGSYFIISYRKGQLKKKRRFLKAVVFRNLPQCFLLPAQAITALQRLGNKSAPLHNHLPELPCQHHSLPPGILYGHPLPEHEPG